MERVALFTLYALAQNPDNYCSGTIRNRRGKLNCILVMDLTEFANRGLNSRADAIIPKAVRDANPLTCNGDTFISIDKLENWVYLK